MIADNHGNWLTWVEEPTGFALNTWVIAFPSMLSMTGQIRPLALLQPGTTADNSGRWHPGVMGPISSQTPLRDQKKHLMSIGAPTSRFLKRASTQDSTGPSLHWRRSLATWPFPI